MTEPLRGLASQTIGPFYHHALTANALGCMIGPDTKGERIRLRLRLLDGDGAAVPDGMIELWQADAKGQYRDSGGGFGRLATDGDGLCVFETIRPGEVSAGRGGVQASHINVSIFARGLLNRLVTRIYFVGDASLDKDPVLALVPADRRATLLAQPGAEAGQWSLDIRLQGEHETVFFDV